MSKFGSRKAPATKDKFKTVETQLKNTEMAGKLTQMMIQQILENSKSMGEDISRAFQQIYDLQYKVLALQDHFKVDGAQLQALADAKRLKDFDDASATQDTTEGLEPAELVSDDSTVILTSTTANGQGIFRSRIKLAETGVADLIQGFSAKPVGTKVKATLNGTEHEVELLGIRTPKQTLKAVADETTQA